MDVFFVISGFLITQNLLRERWSTGTIRLGRFFGGRLARLAPAAVTTVLATVFAVYWFLPPLDRIGTRFDAIAALLGVENLRLADSGTDYLAAHTASPFQQFWSLGVEEQFYVGWALVLALVCAAPVLRRRLLPITLVLCITGLGTMLAMANLSGPWTFFAPHTRAWEFLAGALVAVAAAVRPSRRASWVAPVWMDWAQRSSAGTGLVLISLSFVAFDETTPFPGIATALPVAGAVLLVLPGSPGDPVRRLLGTRPLRWIGDRSYSLYLWHWPVFLLPTLAWDRELRLHEVLLALAVTVAIGWASHAVLERSAGRWLRAARWRPGVMVGAAALTTALVLPLTVLPVLHSDAIAAPPSDGAVLSGPSPTSTVPANVSPTIQDVASDLPIVYRDGCHSDTSETAPAACEYGSPAGQGGTVVLFGDSHAAQWASPVIAAATTRGMRVVTFTKSSCPVADIRVRSTELGRAYDECDAWRVAALQRIEALAPDAVLVASAGDGYESLRDGTGSFTTAWQHGLERTLAGIDAPTVLLHDTPRWPTTPNRCLSASVDDVAACAQPAEELVRADIATAERNAARATGALTADTVPWLCDALCSPVVWNVLAYRDTNHLTDQLARTLTPRIDQVLGDVVR